MKPEKRKLNQSKEFNPKESTEKPAKKSKPNNKEIYIASRLLNSQDEMSMVCNALKAKKPHDKDLWFYHIIQEENYYYLGVFKEIKGKNQYRMVNIQNEMDGKKILKSAKDVTVFSLLNKENFKLLVGKLLTSNRRTKRSNNLSSIDRATFLLPIEIDAMLVAATEQSLGVTTSVQTKDATEAIKVQNKIKPFTFEGTSPFHSTTSTTQTHEEVSSQDSQEKESSTESKGVGVP